MLKKPAFIIILLVLVLSSTFAYSLTDKIGLSVKASPYTIQLVNYKNNTYPSQYGFGFELGYRHYVWKGFAFGIDLKYENFSYKGLTGRYQVTAAAIKNAWTQMIGDTWSVDGEIGFGIQGRTVDSTAKDLFLYLSAYVGGGYSISEKVRITAGVVFEPTFQMDSKDYGIGLMAGSFIAF